METAEELGVQIEILKNMLVARCTSGAYVDDYSETRQRLIEHPSIKDKLPQFVLGCRTLDEFWGFIKLKFDTYAKRREFIREAFDSLLTFIEQSSATPSDDGHNLILGKVDSDHIQIAWRKALERRAADPEGAITAARTLVEAVCKHILDSLEVSYDENAELPKLYALVAENLNLSPSQHTEQIFKQILGGCKAVVEGLGAVRNKHGDAHGPRRVSIRPAPRHAELAVNLAGTMVTFLISTWEARTKKGG